MASRTGKLRSNSEKLVVVACAVVRRSGRKGESGTNAGSDSLSLFGLFRSVDADDIASFPYNDTATVCN